jgi:hypothetical protein
MAKRTPKQKKWTEDWNDRHPQHVRLHSIKTRAKRKGLEFNLTPSDIVIPDVCPVLGIPIIQGQSVSNDNSPSIDRIDNTKGYVRGNIRIISDRANKLKSDGALEEIVAIAVYMATHLANTKEEPQGVHP